MSSTSFAVVAGGSSGIGLELVRQFAEQGLDTVRAGMHAALTDPDR